MPTAPPLILLNFPAKLSGMMVRVYQDIEAFPTSLTLSTIVPPHGLVAFSGIFSEEEFPSNYAGIITIGPANLNMDAEWNTSFEVGMKFEAFQLTWGVPTFDTGCGAPLAGTYFLESAGVVFTVEEGGLTRNTRAAYTIWLKNLKSTAVACCEGGQKNVPWPWQAQFTVEVLTPFRAQGSDAFAQAIDFAWNNNALV